MLPPLGENGDLPVGIHHASWAEIAGRFGTATEARVHALARLLHLHELAVRTGKLKRFCVFGSFVTSAPEPHDVDVALLRFNHDTERSGTGRNTGARGEA